MKIKGLLEVILYVQDMEKMVWFYRDVLGLSVGFNIEGQTIQQLHWVTFDTGTCSLALHSGGTGHQGPDAPKIVFHVDDLQTARITLLALDVPMGQVRSPAPGVAVCDGRDPEDNAFSIESRSILST